MKKAMAKIAHVAMCMCMSVLMVSVVGCTPDGGDGEEVLVEPVDLGLSVKWAPFNVGASSPEESGNYYAWGDVQVRDTVSWEKYIWGKLGAIQMKKYSSKDGLTVLENEDDVARVKWGKGWRMPTREEFQELIDECEWARSYVETGEGDDKEIIHGYTVTAPNGVSIFLPAAGYQNGDKIYGTGYFDLHGYYWSSSLCSEADAYALHFSGGRWSCSKQGRFLGFPIRPVAE